MGKFYTIITVVGMGIAGLFGYHWYDTESSIQTIQMHEEVNSLSKETNVSSGSSSVSSNSSGEVRFFGISERYILSQKTQKNN
ncbi:hypothetical protein SAMN05421781_0060 [Marinococcus luteus]|jgi:hypothetical protein|uniref:Uncharacterized protein n=1 Tax=Marinococcus luteus TaxID=1122204 RepID=A0A1H2PZR9_9BACI|nr:hypothetical protein [Marinococcus luteus]SDW00353.1 hypothetical protein SAMN05421781_0060 [Marinococcus luteus]